MSERQSKRNVIRGSRYVFRGSPFELGACSSGLVIITRAKGLWIYYWAPDSKSSSLCKTERGCPFLGVEAFFVTTKEQLLTFFCAPPSPIPISIRVHFSKGREEEGETRKEKPSLGRFLGPLSSDVVWSNINWNSFHTVRVLGSSHLSCIMSSLGKKKTFLSPLSLPLFMDAMTWFKRVWSR